MNKKKFVLRNFVIISLILISFLNISSASILNLNDDLVLDKYNIKTNSIDLIFNSNDYDILYPLTSIPALIEKNSILNISFKADEFDDLSVFISTAFEPVVDEFLLETENLFDKGNSIWNIEVIIPSDLPEELYNLSLLFSKNDDLYLITEPRAVNVYDNFSDNFSFVHIADLHYGDPRGLVESINESIGFKSIKRCIKEINLLHPDFVIISGDLVFGQLYFMEYHREYEKIYDLLQTFDVPTFLTPGNHDGYRRIGEDGLELWQDYFGPLYYSFDFGDYHFISVNSYDMAAFFRFCFLFIPLNWGGSISDTQLSWIESDIKSSDAKLDFMFMHHNPIWDTKSDSLMSKGYENREELLLLIYDNDVDMVLAGHNHLDTVNIENDVIFITTTTPQSEISSDDGYWGYRMIDVRGGIIDSYNYKDPKYSIPSYHLDYEITTSDKTGVAVVDNDLEIDVDVTIRFLMPKGIYGVDNGEIILQRDNDLYTELYIHSNIHYLSVEEVVIFGI